MSIPVHDWHSIPSTRFNLLIVSTTTFLYVGFKFRLGSFQLRDLIYLYILFILHDRDTVLFFMKRLRVYGLFVSYGETTLPFVVFRTLNYFLIHEIRAIIPGTKPMIFFLLNLSKRFSTYIYDSEVSFYQV